MSNQIININKRIVIILSIFLVTFLIIQLTQSVKRTHILKPLSDFPEQIDGWKRIEKIDLSDAVSSMLGVDDYINYNYLSPQGNVVNLYISYFEALGVTGGYHSPLNCMPGGGAKILKTEIIQINNDLKKIKKLTLEQNKAQNFIYYWYYNRGRIVHSEYAEKIYLVLDAVFKGRRDGAFIRFISYPNKNNEFNTDQVMDFIGSVNEILTQYLPGKTLEKRI